MSTNSVTEQDVRHHYTLVCQCEWSEDEFTRTTESRNCVIHGDEPDPLYALLAEVEQLRAALERACFIAEHLMEMTDQEAWRETGAIGPEGQYEGDFRQSLIWDEIQQLGAVRG